MVRLAGHGAEHGHPGYLPFLGFFGGNNRSWPIARAATHPGRLEANAWLMRRCGGDWDWYKSQKAIHTLGVVVCRIINYKGTLVFERGAIYATTFLQRSKIGKVGVSLGISKVYTL